MLHWNAERAAMNRLGSEHSGLSFTDSPDYRPCESVNVFFSYHNFLQKPKKTDMASERQPRLRRGGDPAGQARRRQLHQARSSLYTRGRTIGTP